MTDTPTHPSVPAMSATRYEQLYTMLLDAMPSSVLLIAQNLRILSANRNFLEKSQRTLSETIGYRLEDVLPAVILEQMNIARRVQHAIETSQSVKGERMTYRAPGVPLRIYYYSLIPFAWQGQTEGVILLMDDVTEQVRLSEEVRRVERHLASIVDSASDLIVSADRGGRILTWNAAAERLLGYAVAEMRGRGFSELCAAGDQAEIQDVFTRIEKRRTAQVAECLFKTKQALPMLVSWVFSPLLDHSGQTVGVVGVGRDLTERRKIETELIQSQKLAALGVMAGGIAHEIRNPLAICSSAAQFLLEEKCTHAFRRECADKIYQGIQRASLIIENLLKYSGPGATSLMVIVDLVALVRETLSLLAHHAALQRVEIKLSGVLTHVPVQGVAVLLQQLFMNLLQNAIKAMPNGGVVTIEMRTADGEVQIRITDTGCGVTKENLGKLFDPFYTTSPVGQGTGLGLSICYSIAKLHNGSIDVVSTEGHGSTFTVKLPLSLK